MPGGTTLGFDPPAPGGATLGFDPPMPGGATLGFDPPVPAGQADQPARGHEPTIETPAIPTAAGPVVRSPAGEMAAEHSPSIPPLAVTSDPGATASPAVATAQELGLGSAPAERSHRWEEPLPDRPSSVAGRWMAVAILGALALLGAAAYVLVNEATNREVTATVDAGGTSTTSDDLVRSDDETTSTRRSLVGARDDRDTTDRSEPKGPGIDSPSASPSTTDPPATEPDESTTTTSSSTTTSATSTTTTTSTTSSTTESTAAATVTIVSAPAVSNVTAQAFSFSLTTNDVCGSSSFTVVDKATGSTVGSSSGNGGCGGPTYTTTAAAGAFDLVAGGTYSVTVTISGTGSDGARPAGSGQASATFEVTTSAS